MKLVHDCKEELKNADLKVTTARLGVLQLLESTETPVDAGEILHFLKKNKIKADKVTVFRMLNTFTEKGLTKQVQLNEHKLRFEYANAPEHHHFICESCGAIEDISDCNIELLEKYITAQKGLLIKRHSLEFFGQCTSCQR
jgi:Fe2+ or Zn2+ uptake regulation protein